MGRIFLFSFIRVFSTVESRKAAEEEIKAFEQEADVAAMKGSEEIDEKTISKFPTVETMATNPGKKEGEMKVFREGR